MALVDYTDYIAKKESGEKRVAMVGETPVLEIDTFSDIPGVVNTVRQVIDYDDLDTEQTFLHKQIDDLTALQVDAEALIVGS